jgi:thiamine biosynthesis lipoprotein ApbE
MGHDDPQLRVASHHPLLGTAIELRIVGPPSVTQLVEVTVVAETQRLEHVFSAFAETSELNRWRHGPADSVSDEFSSLLRTALRWQTAGHGAFNPDVGRHPRRPSVRRTGRSAG